MNRETLIAMCIWCAIVGVSSYYGGRWAGYAEGMHDGINSCRTLRGEEPLP